MRLAFVEDTIDRLEQLSAEPRDHWEAEIPDPELRGKGVYAANPIAMRSRLATALDTARRLRAELAAISEEPFRRKGTEIWD